MVFIFTMKIVTFIPYFSKLLVKLKNLLNKNKKKQMLKNASPFTHFSLKVFGNKLRPMPVVSDFINLQSQNVCTMYKQHIRNNYSHI